LPTTGWDECSRRALATNLVADFEKEGPVKPFVITLTDEQLRLLRGAATK
jgi:hypothetical protein